MARKTRVNIKFLVILSVVIVLGGVAALAGKRLLHRQKPEKFIQAGDEMVAKGNFAEAANDYKYALALNQQDAPTYVKLGKALTELTGTNVEMVGQSRAAFEHALEVDPNYQPALEELLNYYISASQIEPRAEFFEKMRDVSQRILKNDPTHKRAQSYQSIAVIQGWLFGVETEASKIDQHLATLEKLALMDPVNPELPYYVALAKIKRGQDLDRQMQRKDAEDSWNDAATVFDKPLGTHGDIPAMQFRASQIFVSLAQADSKNKDKYFTKAKECQQHAMSIAKADDPQLTDMYIAAADVCKQQGDLAGAEKTIRDLLEKRPDEQAGRLFLAQLVGGNPARRQEMIDLLAKPVTGGQSLRGMKALLVHEYKLQTLIQLANLRMDAYVNAKDDKDRETLLAQIKDNYKSFTDEVGEVPVALKLKGKLQLLQNQPIDAIQTLSRAQSLMQQHGQKDYDLMYVLAKAYFLTNQTGQSKALLTQVLDRFKELVDARLLLTQMQLKDNALSDAKANLDILEKQAPGNPDVIKLRIAALNAEGRKEEINKYFLRLPDTSRQEKLTKAQAAVVLGHPETAVAILEPMRTEKPGDLDVSAMLARVYASQNNKDKAIQVLGDVLKLYPDNKSLKATLELIKGAKPDEIFSQLSVDEFSKEINLAEYYRSQGKRDEFIQHLNSAAKLQPNNPQVLDFQFQIALQDRKYDVAATYIDGLAKANRDQAGGLLYRFRLAMAKGETDEALSIARDLTSKLPEFAQSWLSLAQALHASGQFEQAAQKYVIALEKQNNNPDAIRGIIECYYRLNKPDDAKRYILQARQSFPNDPYFREMEITYNQNFGDPEKAITSREEILAKDPKQPNNWIAAGAAYLRAAQAKLSTDQSASDAYLEKARDKFTKGQQQWPDERMFYGYLADCAMVKNDTATAERWLLELVGRDAWKDKPDPQLMLATLYERAGRVDKAEKALRQAVADSKDSKDSVDVVIRLAAFLSQQHKSDEALKLLSAFPSDPRAQRQRVDVLISGGKFADAETGLNELLVKAPNDSQLLSLLVVVYMSTGKYDQAVEKTNQILGTDPKNAGALLSRGLVRLNQGKYDDAAADLSAVRDQNPTNVEARLALADCYRRRNEPENAARELVAALKVIPLNKVVRLRLVELYCAMTPGRWAEAQALLDEAKGNPQLQKDPDWLRTEAKVWLARGNASKAVQSAKQAVDLAPDNLGVFQDYLDSMLQAKDYRGILTATDPLVEKKSELWWIYSARGIAKHNLSDKATALEEFQKGQAIADAQHNDDASATIIRNIASEIGVKEAIERIGDRKEPRWLLMKVYLYQSDNDNSNAIRMLEQAMAQFDKMSQPEQDSSLRVAGVVYLTMRPPQVEKAKDAYMKLLERNPNDNQSLNNLACLLVEQSSPPNPQEALKYSTRAYENAQRAGQFEPLIIDTQGWVLVLNGRTDEGINTLRTVVDKKPFLDALYHLGEAYLKASNPEEAQKQLARASELVEKLLKQPNQVVDLQMKSKIDQALDKAKTMRQQKNEAKAAG